MLVVGMPGLTPVEWRTHFSLWCIAAAPLWAGIDLTTAPQEAMDIFTNAEAVAVDQDPLGKMGTRVSGTPGQGEVFAKPLNVSSTGSARVAVVLFNGNDTANATVSVSLQQLGLQSAAEVRNLWTHQSEGTVHAQYTVELSPHDSQLLLFSQV
eukprot:m.306183 g.306183  ORF g.306183 m.306183 type:complete len:153 (+) comp23020_c0_seq3:86-544(+)